jgi:hypothetical protein
MFSVHMFFICVFNRINQNFLQLNLENHIRYFMVRESVDAMQKDHDYAFHLSFVFFFLFFSCHDLLKATGFYFTTMKGKPKKKKEKKRFKTS